MLPVNSDPTMKDSDGDDIPDNEDLEPLKIFLHELLQKLELMEKYIDEYMPQFIGDSYLPQDYSPSNMRIWKVFMRIVKEKIDEESN